MLASIGGCNVRPSRASPRLGPGRAARALSMSWLLSHWRSEGEKLDLQVVAICRPARYRMLAIIWMRAEPVKAAAAGPNCVFSLNVGRKDTLTIEPALQHPVGGVQDLTAVARLAAFTGPDICAHIHNKVAGSARRSRVSHFRAGRRDRAPAGAVADGGASRGARR
jgi:hypothetical protein